MFINRHIIDVHPECSIINTYYFDLMCILLNITWQSVVHLKIINIIIFIFI